MKEIIRYILNEETNYLQILKELVEPFKNEDCVCDISIWYDEEDDMYSVYLVLGTEELNDKFYYVDGIRTYRNKLVNKIKDEIKSYLPIENLYVGSYGKPNCWWKPINESKEDRNKNSSLHNLLNLLFKGFDDIYYDWANYNCGMGECCDPYAIGFTLPESHYDDYIFKLVDDTEYDDDGDYPKELRDDLPAPCYEQPDIKEHRFNTIVFYGYYAEDIEKYMGSEDNWSLDLLNIINEMFGCNAKTIIIL